MSGPIDRVPPVSGCRRDFKPGTPKAGAHSSDRYDRSAEECKQIKRRGGWVMCIFCSFGSVAYVLSLSAKLDRCEEPDNNKLARFEFRIVSFCYFV